MIKIIGVEDGVLIAEEVCVDCGVKLHDLTPAEVDAKAILKGEEVIIEYIDFDYELG